MLRYDNIPGTFLLSDCTDSNLTTHNIIPVLSVAVFCQITLLYSPTASLVSDEEKVINDISQYNNI